MHNLTVASVIGSDVKFADAYASKTHTMENDLLNEKYCTKLVFWKFKQTLLNFREKLVLTFDKVARIQPATTWENKLIHMYLSIIWSTIIFIFWDFLMFYQIFLSLKVKRCAIITYKHGICELLHELPNDLRIRIWGN